MVLPTKSSGLVMRLPATTAAAFRPLIQPVMTCTTLPPRARAARWGGSVFIVTSPCPLTSTCTAWGEESNTLSWGSTPCFSRNPFFTATMSSAMSDEGPTATTTFFRGCAAVGSFVPDTSRTIASAPSSIRGTGFLARIMREHTPALTPTLSLSEGEEAISMPSPPEGQRDRVRGTARRGIPMGEQGGLGSIAGLLSGFDARMSRPPRLCPRTPAVAAGDAPHRRRHAALPGAEQLQIAPHLRRDELRRPLRDLLAQLRRADARVS